MTIAKSTAGGNATKRGNSPDSTPKKGPGGWRLDVDLDAFKEEIDTLGKKLRDNQGKEDLDHLHKMMLWQRLAFWGGFLTCFYSINPISIFLISAGICAKWTMLGHHICHGGYDKCSPYNRRTFAVGFVRRAMDWLDWMLPEAWNVEHNQYHHYQLGERGDPDLVEDNMAPLHKMDVPLPLKYFAAFFFMLTWKWYYYAPNTLKELKAAQGAKMPVNAEGRSQPMTILTVFGIHSQYLLELLVRVYLPYFAWTFVILPAPFYFVLGYDAFYNVFVSMVLAEILTNIHAFIIIVPNHAGDDVYRFDTKVYPKSGEFYLRQIIGSVNFSTGDNVTDFMHGWLNYQIEHHLWPDLSMLTYQRAQPLVKAICEKHGVPYVQQSVWIRLYKTLQVFVGTARMKQWEVDA